MRIYCLRSHSLVRFSRMLASARVCFSVGLGLVVGGCSLQAAVAPSSVGASGQGKVAADLAGPWEEVAVAMVSHSLWTGGNRYDYQATLRTEGPLDGIPDYLFAQKDVSGGGFADGWSEVLVGGVTSETVAMNDVVKVFESEVLSGRGRLEVSESIFQSLLEKKGTHRREVLGHALHRLVDENMVEDMPAVPYQPYVRENDGIAAGPRTLGMFPTDSDQAYVAVLDARSDVPNTIAGAVDSGLYVRLAAGRLESLFPPTYVNVPIAGEHPWKLSGFTSLPASRGRRIYQASYYANNVVPQGEVTYTAYRAMGVDVSRFVERSVFVLDVTFGGRAWNQHFTPRPSSETQVRESAVLGGVCEAPVQYALLRHMSARQKIARVHGPARKAFVRDSTSENIRRVVGAIVTSRELGDLEYGVVRMKGLPASAESAAGYVRFTSLPGYYVYVPKASAGFCVMAQT